MLTYLEKLAKKLCVPFPVCKILKEMWARGETKEIGGKGKNKRKNIEK
jgi:hypothetical protein